MRRRPETVIVAVLTVVAVGAAPVMASAQARGRGPSIGHGIGTNVDAWPYYPDSPDGFPYPAGPYAQPYPGPYPGPYPDTAPRRPSGPPPLSADEIASRSPAWFYCDGPSLKQEGGFYPYVKTCPAGWRPMPMGPPPQGTVHPPAVPGLARCESPQGYYPYVTACQGGWVSQSAGRPQGAPSGPGAYWAYCAAEAGFAPYVQSCQAGWREIAAVPPPDTPPGPTASR